MKNEHYAHITRNPRILRGIPVIVGTRTPVRSVAGYCQMGMSADEILQSLPHLTLAKIHSALAYYFDHKRDIDRDLERTNDLDYWKRQAEKLQKVAA